jgi:hypothetical protein
MKVEFAITYCCQSLNTAVLNREWWFQIDTNNSKCSLIDVNDIIKRPTCPFCDTSIDDVLDVSIEELETTIL